MRKSCEETIPPKLFQNYEKPGWNSSVNAAHRCSKAAWKRWKLSDNPNNSASPARESYLKAKCEFQKTLRAWKHDQDFSFYASLDLNHNSDKLTFPTFAEQIGTQPNLTNCILIDNQVYSGSRILEGWAKHFKNLGQPSNHDYD